MEGGGLRTVQRSQRRGQNQGPALSLLVSVSHWWVKFAPHPSPSAPEFVCTLRNGNSQKEQDCFVVKVGPRGQPCHGIGAKTLAVQT